MNIAELIKQLAKNGDPVNCMICTVTKVDKDARTVDCDPINEDAPILDVNLQANQNGKVGLVQIPRVGSFVVVGFLAGVSAGVVLLCEDIESIDVVVGSYQLHIDDNGIVMNGGKLGGLVKVEDLTTRLNLIENEVNAIKQVFSSWSPVPNDGGASLKVASASWSGQKLEETKRSDYENQSVKQ